MSKAKTYKILLKNLPLGKTVVDFLLTDAFFKEFDNHGISGGEVKALITIQRRSNLFEFFFEIEGFVSLSCDRCLDEMEQEISSEQELLVKFGDRFSDEDDVIIVPESEGAIDVGWLLYEFVVLSIPAKRVHEIGECNEEMIRKLKKHIAYTSDDDSENALLDLEYDEDDEDDDEKKIVKEIDARWEALKKISDNN